MLFNTNIKIELDNDVMNKYKAFLNVRMIQFEKKNNIYNSKNDS